MALCGSSMLLLVGACWHWMKWDGPVQPDCQAEREIDRLSPYPQPKLGWFSREIAFASTPFKRRGLSGWRETYCTASATGTLVYDAAHSTDGFWTLDLRLEQFNIGAHAYADTAARFIRVEVEPHTTAHDSVARRPPRTGERITTSGVLVIDTDANFLEIHPTRELRLESKPPPVKR